MKRYREGSELLRYAVTACLLWRIYVETEIATCTLNYLTEMRSDPETGSYLRLIDSCTTQLKAQEISWTCNQGKTGEEERVPSTQHNTAWNPELKPRNPEAEIKLVSASGRVTAD